MPSTGVRRAPRRARYARTMSLGIWIAVGLCLGVMMWLVTGNAVLLGAGMALGIALGVATKSK